MTEKYYRTVIQVEVLSEGEPADTTSLEIIGEQIDSGDWSGKVTVLSSEPVGRKEMARLLRAQGSAPEFLLHDYQEGEEDEGDGKRIIAKISLQRWSGDTAITFAEQEIDVTERVLALSEEERANLQDQDYSTDNLVNGHPDFKHDGPFEVYVEESIAAYFGEEVQDDG